MSDTYQTWHKRAKEVVVETFGAVAAQLWLSRMNRDLRCCPERLLQTKQGCKDLIRHLQEKKNAK